MSGDSRQVSIYDEVAYPSYPYPLSHPDHLAVIARLTGLDSPPVDECRVLELGCGAGGNVLPLADTLPSSQFVGLDLSDQQVALGRQTVDQLGLSNVQLDARDILEIAEDLGEFDYIVCQGVYSWTRDEVRQQILLVCQQHLSPRGVAYVNFNTYPGWQMLGMVRDLVRHHSRQHNDPASRVAQARRVLQILAESVAEQDSPYHAHLKQCVQTAQQYSDAFLFHVFLNVVNQPFYLHEFVTRANAAGLQYLGDADASLSWPHGLSANVEKMLGEIDCRDIDRQQFLDYSFEVSSRRSLLCQQPIQLHRDWPPDSLDGFYLAAQLTPEPTTHAGMPAALFRSPTGRSVTTADPATHAALMALAQAWPESIPLEHLDRTVAEATVGQTRDKPNAWQVDLARCFVARMVELRLVPPTCRRRVGERPRATPLARHQAKNEDFVTNLWHQVVRINDMDRRVLALLDGQRDHDTVRQLLNEQVTSGAIPAKSLEATAGDLRLAFRQSLQRLSARALLA